jgi:hypothetical protein
MPAARAHRGSPTGYTAVPRTLAERMDFLRRDAERILARPEAYRVEEIAWACDMVAAAPPAGNAETRP